MADPMTPERLAEIREHVAWTRDRYNCVDDFHHAGARGCVDLLAEVERLREQLAAFVPPGTLGAGETPALCGTCKDRLCVPGLPGCARCVAEQVERLVKVTDHRNYLRERLRRSQKEAAGRKAHGERLRAELAETTHALTVTGEKVEALRGQRDRAEAERDAYRADLAAFWDAGRTEDLTGLIRDYLGPAVDWQTTNGGAPEWLVQAVLDLLVPIAATRDAAHSELAEVHEQLREARTGQERLAEQRDAAIQLVSDAYTDAGANVQEGGSWPEWGPSVDGDDVLKALGALDGTEGGR